MTNNPVQVIVELIYLAIWNGISYWLKCFSESEIHNLRWPHVTLWPLMNKSVQDIVEMHSPILNKLS